SIPSGSPSALIIPLCSTSHHAAILLAPQCALEPLVIAEKHAFELFLCFILFGRFVFSFAWFAVHLDIAVLLDMLGDGTGVFKRRPCAGLDLLGLLLLHAG